MKKNITLTVLFLLAGVLVSCNQKATNVAEGKQPFALSDTMAAMISIDTVSQTKVQSELKLTGKISFNEEKVLRIYPLVAGTVKDVKVELGDYVHKGQVLAVLRSSEVAGLSQEKNSAEGSALIAKRNLDATEEMYKAGVSSEKDLLIAQREYAKAQAEQKRLNDIFQIYHISGTGEYVITAAFAGFIVEKNVSNEMQIRSDNNSTLFTISPLDNVWVIVNVYESDIAKIKKGYNTDVSTLSYEGKIFHGKVDKIFNVLDSETKVLKVRINLQNPNYLLKPGMFANVTVRYHEEQTLPSVRSSSVIFDDSKNYVVVYRSRTDIERREVTPYKTVGERTYMKNGLKGGEFVINKYHLLVNDALND